MWIGTKESGPAFAACNQRLCVLCDLCANLIKCRVRPPPVGSEHSHIPSVSSEVETPIGAAPSPMGISTSLDANELEVPGLLTARNRRLLPRSGKTGRAHV